MASLVRLRSPALSSAARLLLRSVSTSSVRGAEGPNIDTPTHTGQAEGTVHWTTTITERLQGSDSNNTEDSKVFDKNDYRRIRFMDKDKLVNTQFAIDLIAQDPIVVVNDNHVFSDSGGPLGHPKVYINLDKPQVGKCGYSGRKFIQDKYYNEAQHGPSVTYAEYLAQVRSE